MALREFPQPPASARAPVQDSGRSFISKKAKEDDYDVYIEKLDKL